MASTNKNNYTGSKNIPGVYQKIINNIPVCTAYYELFAGSGAIGKILSVRAVNTNFLFNEIDPTVISSQSYPAGSTVTNFPAIEILQTLLNVWSKYNIFIFLDPPYLHETRPNQTELYDIEMTTDDHIQLLNTLLQLKVNCMIIHPSCDLYNKMLSSWYRVQVKIRYHKKTSIEYLYMNYPKPEKLLCYDFVGSDCWDRQRIKRKADKLVHKLAALPAAERNLLISHINNAFK